MNQCIFVGNVSKMNELRQGSTPYIKFSVAVNRRYGEGNADFVNFTAFGKTAEYISNWVKVGQKVAVVSRFQTSSYEKDGKTYYSSDFIVDSIETHSKPELGNELNHFTDAELEELPFD